MSVQATIQSKLINYKTQVKLVIKDFLQKPDLNYSYVYSFVGITEIVRLKVTIKNDKGWFMFHLDVKSTFLNRSMDELIFVTQPPWLKIKDKDYIVYRLNKTLYSVKQTPNA